MSSGGVFTASCGRIVKKTKEPNEQTGGRVPVTEENNVRTGIRNNVRLFLFLIGHILLAAAVGTLALWGAFALPDGSVDTHINESASVFAEEGTYPYIFSWCTSQLDNTTDAAMMLESLNVTEGNALRRAMLVPHLMCDSDVANVTLVNHYVGGKDFTGSFILPRYWHGYQIWLKPLLSLVNYQMIRILNGILQGCLIAGICWLLYRRKRSELILPMILIYGMLMPVTLAMSMQFSSAFYLAMLSVLALLLNKDKGKIPYIFLYAGIATAFFDYLTYPAATFGIPAVLYCALTGEKDLRKTFVSLIRFGICWGLGYAGMWAMKWVIASWITGVDVISDARNQAMYRMSDSYEGFVIHYFHCAKMCAWFFIRTPFTIPVVLYCGWMIVKIILQRKKDALLKERLLSVIPFFLLALVPFAWYAVTKNHTYNHLFFTNKAVSVSVLAGMVWLTGLAYRPDRTEDVALTA